MKTEIRLGDVARDTLTGFTGVVVGITKWLHGCKRYSLQSQELKDGKPVDPVAFDLPQLELVTGKPRVASTTLGGGPRPEPGRRR